MYSVCCCFFILSAIVFFNLAYFRWIFIDFVFQFRLSLFRPCLLQVWTFFYFLDCSVCCLWLSPFPCLWQTITEVLIWQRGKALENILPNSKLNIGLVLTVHSTWSNTGGQTNNILLKKLGAVVFEFLEYHSKLLRGKKNFHMVVNLMKLLWRWLCRYCSHFSMVRWEYLFTYCMYVVAVVAVKLMWIT